MSDYLVILEHGETPRGRQIRRNRLRLAILVAAIEGVLVLAGAIPWWGVVLAAAAALAADASARRLEWQTARQVTWIALVSQLIVVLVPLAAALVFVLALVVVVVVAIAAAAALLYHRG
jgi:hypothetical protein